MQDDDVTKKSGIYPYMLTRQEKHLSIRAFNANMKREAYVGSPGARRPGRVTDEVWTGG